MTQVVIVVPGIMGSVLCLDSEVIWPGSVASLVLPYRKMPELMREDLRATDVIRAFSISEQYGALIRDLATCGFRETDTPPTLFVCPYDWRKDNRLAAAILADRIDQAVTLHSPGTEVSLVAHSMGGLISRYYLESGEFSRRSGFATVRRLITLGTPHRGAPLALTAALGMEKRLFLSEDQVLQVASDPRYPALYQLLPPLGEPFAWDEQGQAEYRDIDIYSGEVARALGLVEANLEAARTFYARLDVAKRPPHVRYFFFVGTRQTTSATILLRKVRSRYRARTVELEDAGDGTVPAWSAGITGIQSRPVEGASTARSTRMMTCAGLWPRYLGKAGVLAAVPEHVEVSVRERVSNPEDLVHVALTFASGINQGTRWRTPRGACTVC